MWKIYRAAPHHLAFMRGIHWWPMDSLQQGPVMRKVFWCHYIIMLIVYQPANYIWHSFRNAPRRKLDLRWEMKFPVKAPVLRKRLCVICEWNASDILRPVSNFYGKIDENWSFSLSCVYDESSTHLCVLHYPVYHIQIAWNISRV